MHATIKQVTFHVGDIVSVHYRIIEREEVAGKTKRSKTEEKKERIQEFEGVVLAIHGTGAGKSFLVRRIGAANIGIERIFPVNSPWISKIVVKKQVVVRRAKLNYLRGYTHQKIAQMEEKKKKEVVVKKTKNEKPAVKAVAPKKAAAKKAPAKK